MKMNHTNLPIMLLFLFVAVKTTTVTFYVDHQIEQPLDYVQISATVKTHGDKLQQTINEAAQIIKNIDAVVDVYCHTYAKDKLQCENNVEATAYSIRPQYQIVKNKPIFNRFVVSHEVMIKVKQSEKFGQLVDQILKQRVNRINSLTWKPLQETDNEQETVVEGIAQANKVCQKIGMKLDKIISISEVTDFGQEKDEIQQQGEQQDDEQQQQDQEQPVDINDDIVYYKFVVQCHPKAK